MASCLLFRRPVLTELGGFDERFPMLYNDVDLAQRMAGREMVTWYLPAARVCHERGASTGKVKPRMLREQYRSLIRFLALHDRSGWFWLKAVVLVPLAAKILVLRTLAWYLGRRR
jgi:GT2 family glycosyltransferase